MKRILFISIFLSLLGYANAQITLQEDSYIVSLNKAILLPSIGNLVYPQLVEEYSFLEYIPTIACDTSLILCYEMNFTKSKDLVYAFAAVNNEKKERYIVIDTNNNHDFSDDTLYTIPLPETPLMPDKKKEKCIGIQVASTLHKGEIRNVGIDPFNVYGYKIMNAPQYDKRLEYILILRDYMTADGMIEEIPVTIHDGGSISIYNNTLDEETWFSISYPNYAGEQDSKSFSTGDTIQVQEHLFVLSKVESPNKLYLKKIGDQADYSQIGSPFPIAYARDVKDDNRVKINDLIKGKYVFIDFWGSWCGWCIGTFPKLRPFYEKVKDNDNILVLGVALDEDQNLEKLRSIIQEQNVSWDNYRVTPDENKSISSFINRLGIKAYPTYVILDNTGKVVYKKNSAHKTDEAINFFMDLMKRENILEDESHNKSKSK
ncbi:TlpA disulfide reductase family protein [Dysgonomonas sp. 25]|uniref:TlpA family protein disulfide reductase n=1 Tax=Dysgonomonas sp. 25 TaxID=2302933 RepID=UPI0013D2CD50|nr:TlpA disulfide reductase family protein [Dysgonomonas sp. 25]NDV67923.1 TlpA family protein disulfide reductase [Dysgonomonas sp. 25]